MALSAEFDSPADKVAYAIVASGAAALSYDHARAFFLPFMGNIGASFTPLLLDAVVYWLATACIRQAKKDRPLPMLRLGAYALLSLSVTANALGGATLWERVFMALPAALFGFLTEVQIRLALYEAEERGGGRRDRLTLALWLAHPIGALRALVWKARHVRAGVRGGGGRAGPAARRPRRGPPRDAGPVEARPAGAPRGAAGTVGRAAVARRRRGRLRPARPGRRPRAAPRRADRRPRRHQPGARRREPGALRVHPVPVPVPALRVHPAPAPGRSSGAVSDEAAEMHFAAELADGTVPSQRRIKAELHVGQDRAAQIHARLAALAASDASPSPDADDALTEALPVGTTPDDERTVAP